MPKRWPRASATACCREAATRGAGSEEPNESYDDKERNRNRISRTRADGWPVAGACLSYWRDQPLPRLRRTIMVGRASPGPMRSLRDAAGDRETLKTLCRDLDLADSVCPEFQEAGCTTATAPSPTMANADQ